MALLDSLVSYWKLDELSGTRADSHGANHLTEVNAPAGVPGIIGNGAQFVTANQKYLACASNATLQTGDIGFTFVIWVRYPSFATQIFLSKDNNVSREYVIDYSPNAVRFYINGGGGSRLCQTNLNPPIATFAVFFCWHDPVANTITIQYNQNPVNAISTGAFTPNVGSAEFRIGARQFSGQEGYSNAIIDEVGFWKRVLTAPERAQLWNSGAGLTYPFGETPPPIQAIVSQYAIESIETPAPVNATISQHLIEYLTAAGAGPTRAGWRVLIGSRYRDWRL